MKNKRIHILFPLYDLSSGAIPNWLMGVLRRLDMQRFKVDFLIHNLSPGDYYEEARRLGARIIMLKKPRSYWTYIPQFKKILKEYGPYDVIHSHIGHLPLHLRIAAHCGVPHRIAHIHADFGKGATPSDWSLKNLAKRFFYQVLSPYWIARYSTLVLSVSREAAEASLGSYLPSIPRWEILPCGIEFGAFKTAVNPGAVRQELGIPESAFVIGHAGRLEWEKNHFFLVKIVREINRHEPNMRLLLVGDGPLRAQIEAEAAKAGLSDKVIFTGLRSDVPRLMLGAMDAFVFPSHFEGLGIALIEAQAAGLPCIISDKIVETAVVVQALVKRLSLNDPPSTWAAAASALKGVKSESARTEALRILEKSLMNIENNAAKLQELYTAF